MGDLGSGRGNQWGGSPAFLAADRCGWSPAVLGAEAGAAGGQAIMDGAFANAPAGFEFAVGPGHLVVEPEHLGDAFPEEGPVIGPGPETADVDRPQVEGGLAVDDPFGEVFPGAAGAGDADGVEAGGDEEALQFGRLAEDELIVGSEAFGAVDEAGEGAGLEGGDAPAAVAERFGEFLPIRFEELEGETVGDTIDSPGFGSGLEGAQHDGVAFAAEV